MMVVVTMMVVTMMMYTYTCTHTYTHTSTNAFYAHASVYADHNRMNATQGRMSA